MRVRISHSPRRSAPQPATPRSPSRAASRPPRRSPSSIAWAAPPRSAWRLHRPAGPRRGIRRTIAERSAGCLWPTVVVDERGVALGFCYSDLGPCAPPWSAVRASTARARCTVDQGRDVGLAGTAAHRCRLRSRLPALHGAPAPLGFYHLNTRTCWGADGGPARSPGASPSARSRRRGSYTPSCSPIRPCSAPSCARRRPSWPRPQARRR